ncbi:MAG TPA: hypothetical protein VK760_06565, partial [Candidatus Acidoferrales bacterium]|nr:hypothetical protein [Candidatus Acidoferrales bacterium]
SEPLHPERRDCLFVLAMAGTADEALLAALGREDVEADAAWLRATFVPAVETADGFSLHRSFAQFVLAQIPRARDDAGAAGSRGPACTRAYRRGL